MRPRFVLAVTLLSMLALACVGAWRRPVARASYPLDDLPRVVTHGEKLPCEHGDVELTSYRGDTVRYAKPLRVHPAFKEQLMRFEAIVAELGVKHFGRAPRAIEHFGAYACRPMRRHARYVSEHAFGNAIDVAGFDFGPLPKKKALPASLMKAWRRPFVIRVDKHWHASDKDAAKQTFLRELTERLVARPDVFRSFVGPDYPDHKNHFHLAHPPYRMVKVGDVRRFWLW